MKLRQLLAPLATAFGLVSTASAALVADLQAPLRIALELTRDTNIHSRPVEGGLLLTGSFDTVRLTPRDFIEKLIEEGKIVGPLRGWKLVVRCTSDDADSLDHRVYAVKAGQPDHALDNAEAPILGFDQPYMTSAFRLRTRSEQIVSGRATRKFSVSGTFVAPVSPMDLAGVGELFLDYKPVSLGDARASLPIPSRVELTLGGGFFVENAGEIYIVKGDIVYGRHRVTAIRSVSSE